MIKRAISNQITSRLFRKKAIVILGARQVGKTTLVNSIASEYRDDSIYWNGEEPDIRDIVSGATSTKLKAQIGNKNLVIIDEAQKIPGIGQSMKLIIDNYPDIQLIATGSSSFELSGQTSEPLTGRKYEFHLFPLSFSEMVKHTSLIEEKRMLEHRMLYGYYPGIVNEAGDEKLLLSMITESYLYKDIFSWGLIKKPLVLEKLVQALALQVGNELSYHELGQLVGADNETVERYIDLLEKSFVVFRLQSLNRNLRNEIKKSKKIYFWDNGIRNAVIRNFSPLNLRTDTGALWENYMITEIIKQKMNRGHFFNKWFWRTHAQQEIDFITEQDGKITALEFKWSKRKKHQMPVSFQQAYENSRFYTVTPENYNEFLVND
ncbi:MAG: ATP-binding protein [Bacteroidota bacterium]|nr:ATP-binding protein [Bacteroidota bacterium]